MFWLAAFKIYFEAPLLNITNTQKQLLPKHGYGELQQENNSLLMDHEYFKYLHRQWHVKLLTIFPQEPAVKCLMY